MSHVLTAVATSFAISFWSLIFLHLTIEGQTFLVFAVAIICKHYIRFSWVMLTSVMEPKTGFVGKWPSLAWPLSCLVLLLLLPNDYPHWRRKNPTPHYRIFTTKLFQNYPVPCVIWNIGSVEEEPSPQPLEPWYPAYAQVP